jgi:hypothetical protein
LLQEVQFHVGKAMTVGESECAEEVSCTSTIRSTNKLNNKLTPRLVELEVSTSLISNPSTSHLHNLNNISHLFLGLINDLLPKCMNALSPPSELHIHPISTSIT